MQHINWTITRLTVVAVAAFVAIAPVVHVLAGSPGGIN